MDLTSNGTCKALSTAPGTWQAPLSVAVAVVVGIPGIETEENFEEDSHRPLINGAENEDEAEPNYSIQEGNTVTQVKAISFYQACCLPGVIAVRTVQISPPKPGRYHSLDSSTAGIQHLEAVSFSFKLYFRNICPEESGTVALSLFIDTT